MKLTKKQDVLNVIDSITQGVSDSIPDDVKTEQDVACKAIAEVAEIICLGARIALTALPEVDPVHAAGGCYCCECKHKQLDTDAKMADGSPGCTCRFVPFTHGDWEWCSWGERREDDERGERRDNV